MPSSTTAATRRRTRQAAVRSLSAVLIEAMVTVNKREADDRLRRINKRVKGQLKDKKEALEAAEAEKDELRSTVARHEETVARREDRIRELETSLQEERARHEKEMGRAETERVLKAAEITRREAAEAKAASLQGELDRFKEAFRRVDKVCEDLHNPPQQ